MIVARRTPMLFAAGIAALISCSREEPPSSAMAPNVPAVAPSVDATTTTCDLAGRWTGVTPSGPSPYAGKPVRVLVRADGTARWEVPGASFTGEAVQRPGRLELRDRGSLPANLHCPPVLGSYRTRWAAGCTTLTLELLRDPCADRAAAVHGLRLARAQISEP